MDKYWIILEPYTFVWSDFDRVLLYNSLSKKAFIAMNDEILKPVVLALQKPHNLYSVLIDKDLLNNRIVRDFLSILRNSYCGDIVSVNICKDKLVIVYPLLNINENVDREIESIKKQEKLGRKIMNNLVPVDVYLGGFCSYKCDYCDEKYKQICWCKSDQEILTYDNLCMLMSELSTLNSISINLLGNIFDYPYVEEMLCKLSGFQLIKKVILDCKYIIDHVDQIFCLLDLGFNIGVLVGNVEHLEQLDKLPFLYNKSVEYIFSVRNEKEFSYIANYVSKCVLENASIYPYFDGFNQEFFKTNVWQSETDILTEELSKREIFLRQTINSNFFGKLIVLPNGDILPNINAKPIGRISDGIKNVIYKEIAEGSYWLKTRDKIEPCKNCLYRVLCSPISNYEIALGKMNLCDVILK